MIYKSDDGGDSVIQVGAQITNATLNAGGAVAANWAAVDSFQWNGKVRQVTLGANATAGSVATLDLNDANGATIVVDVSSTIGSVIDSGANSRKANTEISDGVTLTLSDAVAGLKADGTTAQAGGTYSGLGDISLDGGAGGATLAISADTTLSGAINSDGNSEGIITVAADKTVTFDGTIGAGAGIVKTITLTGSAVFNRIINGASAISLNGGDATFNASSAGSTITSKAAKVGTLTAVDGTNLGTLALTNGTIAATVDNAGAVTTGAATTFKSIGTVASITSAAAGGTITAVKVTGALDLTNGGTATVSDTIGGTVTLNNGANVTTTSTVGGNVAFAGASAGRFVGDVTNTDVTGTVTINSTTQEANTLHDAGGNVLLTAGILTMNDAAGTLTVTAGTMKANDVTGLTTLNGGTSTINKIGGNLAMANAAIATVADVTGTVTTTANNTLTITGAGTSGAINNVGTKTTLQGTRTFADITAVGTMALEGSGTSLTFTAGDIGAGVIATNQTDRKNDITVNVAQTLTGSIGTKANPIGSLIINADVAANINTANFHGSVTTATNNTASLVFGTAVNASVLSAGTAAKNLTAVTFTESATVTDGLYADTTTVAAGKTATVGGKVEGDTKFELANAASKAVFKNGVVLNVPITTGNANTGAVKFEGSATISEAIGVAAGLVLNQVDFNNTDSSVAKVGADISATAINVNKGATVQLTAASTFTGATEITDGTLDLGAQALTHTGDMTINGESTIKSTLTAATSTATITGGTITNANFNLVGGAGGKLKVSVVDTGVVRKQGGGRTFTLATSNALTTFTADNLVSTADTTNKLIGWNVTLSGTDTVLTEVDKAATYLKSVTASNSSATIDALTGAADGTDAAQVVRLVEGFANADNADKVTETIERLDKGSIIAADTIGAAMVSAGDTLGARAMAMNMPIRTASTGKVTGVAAGDDATRFGAWASPFYSRANQDERNGFAGYKNESYGASFGLDTKVNEDLTLGVAITASNSNIKHKDLKSGDRTKVNSLLFSIYNTQNITDHWFVSGSATFGTNDVENRSKRVSSTTGYQQADAKYSVTSFDLKQIFGYNYSMAQAVITPMIGAKYSRVSDASYTESGTTIQNLDIATKAFDKFEVVAGVKASGESYDLGGVSITPEAHAFVNYNLFNNSQKQSITLSGTKLSSNSDKAARAKYNLGLGATTEYGSMEYGAAYDLHLSEKRAGHQGSLKVRMNF